MQKQKGSVMLEALISILIFSMGILAQVGLQSALTKNSINAQYRAEAAFLANELIGIMWADKNNISQYAISETDTSSSYSTASTWLTKVQTTLPKGDPIVVVNGNDITITVSWQKNNETAHQYSITSNITP